MFFKVFLWLYITIRSKQNIVELNIIIALSKNLKYIYNVGTGKATKLEKLFNILNQKIKPKNKKNLKLKILNKRVGDIKNSKANIKNIFAEFNIKHNDIISLNNGLNETIEYFLNKWKKLKYT